jgi:hypothetical protein
MGEAMGGKIRSARSLLYCCRTSNRLIVDKGSEPTAGWRPFLVQTRNGRRALEPASTKEDVVGRPFRRLEADVDLLKSGEH